MSATGKRNIKDKYKGCNLYSEKDYDSVFKDSIIVLDTNILLNFYRYSENTRKNLFNVLNKVKDRIWIPYQVIKEYYNNRDKIIDESGSILDEIERDLNSKFKELIKIVNNNSKRIESFDDINSIFTDSKNKLNETFTLLKSNEKSKDKIHESVKIENKLLDLIGSNYEDKFDYCDIEDIIVEGQKRIDNELPPGYMDAKKDCRYDKYIINGDYIIFNSIIKYCSLNKRNAIFITDDQKEDWFLIIDHKKHGGRLELLQEFYENTNQLLLIVTPEVFVSKYKMDNPNVNITDETINEIEKLNKNNYSHINHKYNLINNELSISERQRIITSINNKLTQLVSDLNNFNLDESIYLAYKAEIIRNVRRIELYYIKAYTNIFDKVREKSHLLIYFNDINNDKEFISIVNDIINDISVMTIGD